MNGAGARGARAAAIASTVAVALLAGGTAARAEEGWLVRAAFESGGDEIGTARFVGGVRDGEDERIEAGGQLHVELGLRRGLVRPDWDTELSVGYKVHTATADNGDIGITRVTLNALQLVPLGEKVRLGGGITYHLSPTFEVDIDGQPGRELEYDSALGFQLVADYRIADAWEIGARVVRLEYERGAGNAADGATVDAGSAGAYVTFRF